MKDAAFKSKVFFETIRRLSESLLAHVRNARSDAIDHVTLERRIQQQQAQEAVIKQRIDIQCRQSGLTINPAYVDPASHAEEIEEQRRIFEQEEWLRLCDTYRSQI